MAAKMATTYQFTLVDILFQSFSPNFFHILTTLIKLLFMSEYGFYLMNDNQDFRQNGYPFAAGISWALCQSLTVLVHWMYIYTYTRQKKKRTT